MARRSVNGGASSKAHDGRLPTPGVCSPARWRRKFGASTADRTAELLAGIGDAEGLRRAGEWIIDCATADELVARLENGSP